MENIQIKLAVLWACLMLTYLLGDVLRIFSGDFKPGEIMGQRLSQGMWLGWDSTWSHFGAHGVERRIAHGDRSKFLSVRLGLVVGWSAAAAACS